jgi:hypothetical protein
MKRWYQALMWVSLALFASTAGAQAARKTAEGSMVVTGSLEVNPDGTLHGYTLDQPEKLPPVVVDVLGKSIPHWQFKLSSPTTQVVKTSMSVRVVARPVGEGNYKVSVDGATFGEGEAKANSATVTYNNRSVAPKYPQMAIDARVSGTAYLVLRIGRDGSVQEAVAEEVDLEQYATQQAMDKFRKVLANASLDAARHWTFHTPTQGTAVNDPYWVVRVPVNFNLTVIGQPNKQHAYGTWQAYIPGPRQTVPWISAELAAESPNAMADGSLSTGHSGLVLATPLGGG